MLGIKTRTRGCKNLTTENSFTLHSLLFFHLPFPKFYSPLGEPFARLRSIALTDRKKIRNEGNFFLQKTCNSLAKSNELQGPFLKQGIKANQWYVKTVDAIQACRFGGKMSDSNSDLSKISHSNLSKISDFDSSTQRFLTFFYLSTPFGHA